MFLGQLGRSRADPLSAGLIRKGAGAWLRANPNRRRPVAQICGGAPK